MSYGSSNPAYNKDVSVHLELAILQKDVKASKPGKAPFLIPAIMTDNYKGTKYVNNYNTINKDKTGTPSVSTILIDNEIKLDIPKEYARWYGSKTIPKGTRFIVAFIGGDVNTIRIIGRYETSSISDEDYYLEKLPIASTTELGGIIVGSGLSITDKGLLSLKYKLMTENEIDEIIEDIIGIDPDDIEED